MHRKVGQELEAHSQVVQELEVQFQVVQELHETVARQQSLIIHWQKEKEVGVRVEYLQGL